MKIEDTAFYIKEEIMKNERVRVVENCGGFRWWFGICEGRKMLLETPKTYERKGSAIRCAKAMAKRIGIKFDPEIIKQHGC